MLLFPRLIKPAALRVFETVKDLPLGELGSADCTVSDDATFAETGGQRVRSDWLQRIRTSVCTIAKRYDFPNDSSERNRAAFDATCAVWLLRESGIKPGEAYRLEVWSYLTLEVLPDVAAWRFPDRSAARFLGGVRNVFQRLWIRAFLLEDQDDSRSLFGLLKELREDTFVQITERPGATANPEVARRIAEAWLRAAGRLGSGAMEGTHRKVMKELTQQGAVISFDALAAAGGLDSYLDSLYLEFSRPPSA